MAQFSWITFAQAKAALLTRLNGSPFWTNTEIGLYIIEALRTWNAITAMWTADFPYLVTTPITSSWENLRSVPNYPRVQTLHDSDLYIMMEYHLLEPPTGSAWTGSTQFSITDLSNALQAVRDEVNLKTDANVLQITPGAAVNSRRLILPDNVLDVRRSRLVPAANQGTPNTLVRGDKLDWQFFSAGFMQDQARSGQVPATFPQAYDIVSGPPLGMDTDFTVQVPATWDLLVLENGDTFNPPASSPLNIPDDWSWLLKWGALGDVLASDSEKTDMLRATYCKQRYQQGLALMMNSPWVLLAEIFGVPVDTVPVSEMDMYASEWELNPSAPPCMVLGGMDFVAACPVPTANTSVLLTVTGNAPVPALDGDFVQVTRDSIDAILDYAQHLAMFKCGGAEFKATFDLYQNFITKAAERNDRLKMEGIFLDMMLEQSTREELAQERFLGNG